MKTLTLITGLPGSGKSTLAKIIASSTKACHVEADMWMTRPTMDGGEEYFFDPKKVEHAHTQCQRCVTSLAQDEIPVVVSNTFTMKWEAEPYIKIAEEYGYTVQILHLMGSFGSIHGVPERVMEMMAARRELFSLADFDL